MLKRIALGFAVFIAALVGVYGYLVWNNNRDLEAPSQEELSNALEQAIDWHWKQRADLLKSDNGMLWWMVSESARITGDARLRALFDDYRQSRLGARPSVWQHLFDVDSQVPIRPWELSSLPDYNLYFLYGLTCSKLLEQEEIIQRQGEAEFCARHHPISPACVTHQLMGVRFAQQRGCGNPREIERLAGALREKIVRQLTWDPRVVDVYLQRVLMLAESGDRDALKPVWIRQVLRAQLADGGWSANDPFFSLGERSFGFNARGLGFGRHRSNFHTSAQGLLLLSLLAKTPAVEESQN